MPAGRAGSSMALPQFFPGTGKSFFLKVCTEEANMGLASYLLNELESPDHSMQVSGIHLWRGSPEDSAQEGVRVHSQKHFAKVAVEVEFAT